MNKLFLLLLQLCEGVRVRVHVRYLVRIINEQYVLVGVHDGLCNSCGILECDVGDMMRICAGVCGVEFLFFLDKQSIHTQTDH